MHRPPLSTLLLAASVVLTAPTRPALGSCTGDCGNGDSIVGVADLLALLRQFGGPGSCDLAGDGRVGASDLALLISRWGPCPVSTGACCLGGGLCDVNAEDDCSAAGGKTWNAGAACGDTDGDRLPDVFELADCSPPDGCTVGTDPFNADTDGDGLLDGEEAFGMFAGLDLPGLGADPIRKDLFLEIDWMDDPVSGAHTHRPLPDSMDLVAAAFSASPVGNPCGATGISLHADYGQGGAFTGGNLIGNDVVVVFDSEFNQYKAQHFDPRRRGIFRYSIHCHRYNSQGNSSSGVAEVNGDDSIVSLQNYLTVGSIAVIQMHELGHNLGLRHGGFESNNYKPNYNSVMNYRFTFPGVDVNCDGAGDGVVNYSGGGNPPLDETHLFETEGICGGPIDWDGDESVNPLAISYNVNCPANIGGPCGSQPGGCTDGVCSFLLDHDDWASLALEIHPESDFTAEIITCLIISSGDD